MLRLLFVLGIAAIGAWLALSQGPFAALLLYIWNAYFRPESWVWNADILRHLRISYLVGAYVVATSLVTRQKFFLNIHVGLLGWFALHCVFSASLSGHSPYAWIYLTDFLKALTITYLIAVLTDRLQRLQILILVLAFSLGFEGAKQGWVEMVRNPGAINVNEIPFLGDNNGVAVGMLMLVPFFGALAETATLPSLKWLCRFFLVGVLYRAISTYSRGGLLSCGALALVYWLRARRRIPLLIGFAAVAVLVLPIMPQHYWDRMETIVTYEEEGETSALSRLHFWKVALDMAEKNPLFGVGFSSYNPAYDDYDTSFGKFGRGRSAHSAWFGVLAELGYVGFAAYVGILILAFRNCRRADRAARDNPELAPMRPFIVAVESSLVVFAVGGTFLPFQYNEMLWHVIGISLAIDSMAAQPAAETRWWQRSRIDVWRLPRAPTDSAQPPRGIF